VLKGEVSLPIPGMIFERRDMLPKRRITSWLYLFVLISILYGCTQNFPPAVEPDGEARRAHVESKRMQARVGIYLNDDLGGYDYERRILGVTFRMQVGDSLSSILPQMTSAMMLGNVVAVKSLPPYDDNYRPDVDAVIEPDILYAYGNVSGILTGYVDAKIRMGMTLYDLDGRVLWQDAATGVSRSGELNLAGNYLGTLEKADQTAYEAAFSAAARITDDFNNSRQKGFSIAGEAQIPRETADNTKLSDIALFRQYYQAGRLQYEKRRFYQALLFFEKAANVNPADLSTLFYRAVCYTYTGQRNAAIVKFRKFRELTESAPEIRDAEKWLALLEKPLKIGIVPAGSGQTEMHSALQRVLMDSGMYEVKNLTDLKIPSRDSKDAKFDEFLDKCLKKGMRIVILDDIGYIAGKAVKDSQGKGDVATDYIVGITAKVYSTAKKELKTEIRIDEKENAIKKRSEAEEQAIKERLLRRGAKELVLRLLENDIY
jgi:tetratricopeptide (TPR) repeat protein